MDIMSRASGLRPRAECLTGSRARSNFWCDGERGKVHENNIPQCWDVSHSLTSEVSDISHPTRGSSHCLQSWYKVTLPWWHFIGIWGKVREVLLHWRRQRTGRHWDSRWPVTQTMWHISGRGDKMTLSLLKYQSPEYQPRRVKLDTTCARKALLQF